MATPNDAPTRSLTFKNCNVIMNGIGSTPKGQDPGWYWMSISLGTQSSLNLDNASILLDGMNASNENSELTHGIYTDKNTKLNLNNYSTLTIKNYSENGIAWGSGSTYDIILDNGSELNVSNCLGDGIAGQYDLKVFNSSIVTISDCTNNGGQNLWDITIDNSKMNINNCQGNGLSAHELVLQNNAQVWINNNSYRGAVLSSLNMDGTSSMTLEGNGSVGDSAALRIGGRNIDSYIASGAKLLITNNYCNGINLVDGSYNVNIESAIITNNGNRVRNDGSTSYVDYGGGIYVDGPNLSLSNNVEIFNNHAKKAGDDLHLQSGSITFYNISKENEWILNETQLPITGWYIDGNLDGTATKRWKQDTQEDSYQLFNSFDENGKTVLNTVTSLKAAHAYSYNPETPVNPIKWQVSKSKTATNLDANYQSQVTLSLPAAEKAPVTDVVFVLDRSSSAGDAREEISDMMDSLLEITENSNAVINVGVVNFWYKADTGIGLTRLTKESIDSIKDAIMETSLSGTNIEAGIKAATSMLDASTTLDQNKYMVLVTDGISHAWNGANGDVMTIWGEGFADKDVVFNGANSYFYFDPEKTSFNDVFNTDSSNEKLNSTYDVPVFDGDKVIDDLTTTSYANSYIHKDEYNKYYSGVEKGVYTAAHAYANAASKYKCINLYWNVEGYPVATEFMEWTATQGKCYNITDGASLEKAFEDVERDITYLVDRGSSIVDVIGEGIDNAGNEYDFKFINDINNLNLTVNGISLPKEQIDENTYGFGDARDGIYDFVLTYYPDGIGKEARSQEVIAGELFRLDINVPITIDKPVQLTYTVQLTNPQTADGTYGQYDADGSEEYAGLYTNKMAILYPVDSNHVAGPQEAFQKPTVSYSISNGKPVEPEDPTPRPGGGGDEDDDTPTIINDTPVPTTTIDDEDVPLTDLPEDTVTIDDEEVPLKDIPNTGDMIPVPAMVAAVISIGGIALLMKKHK